MKFIISRSFQNLKTNLGSNINHVVIIATALTLLAVGLLLYLNIKHISENMLSNTMASIFLVSSISEDERNAILQELLEHPFIRSADLVSPEQGLQELESKLGIDFSEIANPEIIPYTIDIHVFEEYADQLNAIIDEYRSSPQISDVVISAHIEQQVNLFHTVLDNVGLIFGVVMLLAFCLIIANASKLSLFVRRNEIEIFYCLGATRIMICLIFTLEAVVMAVVSWGIALGAISSIYYTFLAGITWEGMPLSLTDLTIFYSVSEVGLFLAIIIGLSAFSAFYSNYRVLQGLEP